MKTFTIGDIHGGFRSLKQCLERSNFDKENDHLIVLGDICDGWPETNLVVEELQTVKNLTLILGNHDQWLMDWMQDLTKTPRIWVEQGGRNTLKSYDNNPNQEHYKFLRSKFTPYFIDEENRLFVHGGVSEDVPMTDTDFLMWDRSLAEHAVAEFKGNGSYSKLLKYARKTYKEVYLGHTTVYRHSKTPIIAGNVILMDTGGGFEGILSLMNVETKEFFQSDKVSTLYPEVDFVRG